MKKESEHEGLIETREIDKLELSPEQKANLSNIFSNQMQKLFINYPNYLDYVQFLINESIKSIENEEYLIQYPEDIQSNIFVKNNLQRILDQLIVISRDAFIEQLQKQITVPTQEIPKEELQQEPVMEPAVETTVTVEDIAGQKDVDFNVPFDTREQRKYNGPKGVVMDSSMVQKFLRENGDWLEEVKNSPLYARYDKSEVASAATASVMKHLDIPVSSNITNSKHYPLKFFGKNFGLFIELINTLPELDGLAEELKQRAKLPAPTKQLSTAEQSKLIGAIRSIDKDKGTNYEQSLVAWLWNNLDDSRVRDYAISRLYTYVRAGTQAAGRTLGDIEGGEEGRKFEISDVDAEQERRETGMELGLGERRDIGYETLLDKIARPTLNPRIDNMENILGEMRSGINILTQKTDIPQAKKDQLSIASKKLLLIVKKCLPALDPFLNPEEESPIVANPGKYVKTVETKDANGKLQTVIVISNPEDPKKKLKILLDNFDYKQGFQDIDVNVKDIISVFGGGRIEEAESYGVGDLSGKRLSDFFARYSINDPALLGLLKYVKDQKVQSYEQTTNLTPEEKEKALFEDSVAFSNVLKMFGFEARRYGLPYEGYGYSSNRLYNKYFNEGSPLTNMDIYWDLIGKPLNPQYLDPNVQFDENTPEYVMRTLLGKWKRGIPLTEHRKEGDEEYVAQTSEPIKNLVTTKKRVKKKKASSGIIDRNSLLYKVASYIDYADSLESLYNKIEKFCDKEYRQRINDDINKHFLELFK